MMVWAVAVVLVWSLRMEMMSYLHAVYQLLRKEKVQTHVLSAFTTQILEEKNIWGTERTYVTKSS